MVPKGSALVVILLLIGNRLGDWRLDGTETTKNDDLATGQETIRKPKCLQRLVLMSFSTGARHKGLRASRGPHGRAAEKQRLAREASLVLC
jgi:hypothetical protein